jgi:hypothetical protein
MDLKDFVKDVILDVTNAVKECQDEVNNGAIVSPAYRGTENAHRPESGVLKISYIDFEVAVTVDSTTEVSGEAKGRIKVLSSFLGGKVSEDNKETNGHVSKVKFSIPVVYPTPSVKERGKQSFAKI